MSTSTSSATGKRPAAAKPVAPIIESESYVAMAAKLAAKSQTVGELAQVLLKLAEKDEDLATELMRLGSHSLASDAFSATREAITRPADWSPSTQHAARLHSALRDKWGAYDYTLPGGLRIGEAGVEQLKAAAAFHAGQAKGHAKRHRFFIELAARLEKSKAQRVRDMLSEVALAKILETIND